MASIKFLFLAMCAILGGSLLADEGAVGIDLSRMEGWDIVVAEDALPAELYAAQELQSFLAQACGAQLPIVQAAGRPNRHVFVGPGAVKEADGVGFDVSGFGPEDLRIVVRDYCIAIAGGRPRGTLYGVYTFLEDYVGVRFLTADHTHVPLLSGTHLIGPLDRFYHPPLAFRYPYYGEVHADHAFATRLRINTVSSDPKLGGRTPMRLINHSFSRYMPWARYGKEHPEYYNEIDGRRPSNIKNDHYGPGVQLCLTNPDVLRIVTEGVLKDLEEHPEWTNISVSQNDNRQYCRCAACRAIDEREGSHMGSLLAFVNAVADEVAKKHPGVMVGTLAYQYSRKPPKTLRPRPNVQIQLCSIECCLIHPINDPNCPRNVEFCRDLAGWGKICDNICIWNYNTNFSNYLLPCPNLRVIEPNVRYFVENNAKGVFMQAAGNARGAELSDLRNYVISNLLWDPARSGQELMDEFLDLHYGRAARPIRRFINLVHDTAEASGRHENCFGRLSGYGLDESVAEAGLKAFAEALELAESEEVRRRVEKASVCAYRAAIEPVWYLKDRSGLDPAVAKKMRPLVRKFFELCQRHGVTMVSEGMSVKEAQERIEGVFGLRDTE